MNHYRLRDFFERCREAGKPLVLATVTDTRGSTYSKAGARMLIDGDGRFQGMLSGGCLEGDLAMRARVALDSGTVQYAAYDLASDDDELWGMGVGCDGSMRVMLQPLTAAQAYEPAAALLAFRCGQAPVTVIACVESTDPAIPAGTSLVRAGTDERGNANSDALAAAVAGDPAFDATIPGRIVELRTRGGTLRLLLDVQPPVPRLLVLGAGLDAEPLVRFAAELGWRCTVSDHRPAYVDGNDFAAAESRHCIAVDAISSTLALDEFDFAVVMSHHLASDRAYLRQLADTDLKYIGLLGPEGRRNRLLSELPDCAARLEGRIHAPAGLDLGGRGPAAIALSIIAEMQQHLAHRLARRAAG